MASPVLICACFALIIYKIYKYMVYKPPNFPPGPPRIPFWGSYLFLILINYNHIQLAVDKLCKYYNTNVLGFYFGKVPTLVANDSESVKELLTNEDLDGRPLLLLAKLRDPNFNFRGIFFIEGQTWRTQRRFTLRHLRDFGFGRRFTEFEIEINDELTSYIDMIKNGPKYDHEQPLMKNGNVLCPQIFFALPGNLFLKTLINERHTREDLGRLFRAGQHAFTFQRNGDDYGRMFSLLPWVAKIFPNMSGYNIIKREADGLYNIIKEIVDEQYNTYDEKHMRSFIDLYFKEMKTAEMTGEETTFIYDQLILTCVDFIFPSFSAIGSTLAFFMQRMILHPEIQRKIQQEIDDVVGHGKLPSLDDRINLPYTEASIRENMRYETLVPSGVPHKALKRTTYMGYDLPEGSFVLSSLHASHADPKRWDDPENFRPERFLDTNGKLSLKKDYSLPFGAGRRLCAGETFARNTIFLIVSALL